MKPKREIPKVVPEHLVDEFVGFMDAAYEFGAELPDGAFMEHVSDSAAYFRSQHNLSGSVNHMLHQYAKIKQEQQV